MNIKVPELYIMLCSALLDRREQQCQESGWVSSVAENWFCFQRRRIVIYCLCIIVNLSCMLGRFEILTVSRYPSYRLFKRRGANNNTCPPSFVLSPPFCYLNFNSRARGRTSSALSFLDIPSSKLSSHNILPSDFLLSKTSSQTAVLPSTESASSHHRVDDNSAQHLDGDTLLVPKMSSPRKHRASGEVDPYSAAHIYYGNEVYHTSRDRSRTRTYSTTVSTLLLLLSLWLAANRINP